MSSVELNKREIADLGIKEAIASKEILTGLAEVAAYMDCSISKVRKYARLYGLPVANFTRKGGAYCHSSKSLIQQWLLTNHYRFVTLNGHAPDKPNMDLTYVRRD